MEESDTSPCLWIGFGTVHLAPVTLAINHRVTEEPRLEGTSEDYQVQPFLRKGSLDEIHPIQPHLDNLQWWGPYHISLGWLFVVLCIKNFFPLSRQNLSSKVKCSQYCLYSAQQCFTGIKQSPFGWDEAEESIAADEQLCASRTPYYHFSHVLGNLVKHYSARSSLLIC